MDSPDNGNGAPQEVEGAAMTRTGITPSIAPGTVDSKESDVICLDNYRYWARLRPHPARCEHGTLSGRYCRHCVRARRAVSRELDALCRAERVPEPPSRFGLDDDELDGEFERLAKAGWSPGEVARVVAVRRST